MSQRTTTSTSRGHLPGGVHQYSNQKKSPYLPNQKSSSQSDLLQPKKSSTQQEQITRADTQPNLNPKIATKKIKFEYCPLKKINQILKNEIQIPYLRKKCKKNIISCWITRDFLLDSTDKCKALLSICKGIKISEIKELRLKFNKTELTDEMIEQYLETLTKYKSLKSFKLYAQENLLTQHCPQFLSQTIRNCKLLSHFGACFDENMYRPKRSALYRNDLRQLVRLKTFLYMEGCQILQHKKYSFPHKLIELPRSLKQFAFCQSGNLVSEIKPSNLIHNKNDFHHLQSFRATFSGNPLGDKGAISLGVLLIGLTNIKQLSLNISSCKLTLAGFFTVIQSLCYLDKLEQIFIDVSGNKLSQDDLKKICHQILEVKSLKQLMIDVNDMQLEETAIKVLMYRFNQNKIRAQILTSFNFEILKYWDSLE